jgi:hypothetical protein
VVAKEELEMLKVELILALPEGETVLETPVDDGVVVGSDDKIALLVEFVGFDEPVELN